MISWLRPRWLFSLVSRWASLGNSAHRKQGYSQSSSGLAGDEASSLTPRTGAIAILEFLGPDSLFELDTSALYYEVTDVERAKKYAVVVPGCTYVVFRESSGRVFLQEKETSFRGVARSTRLRKRQERGGL